MTARVRFIEAEFKPIYVLVYDPRTLVKVLRALEALGIEPKGVDAEQKVIEGVVIADDKGLEWSRRAGVKIRGTVVRVEEDAMCTALRASHASKKGGEGPLIVGVDLGENIGVAIVVGRSVVYAGTHRSSSKAIETLLSAVQCFSDRRRIVRIGIPKKDSEDYERVVKAIIESVDQGVELEMVPEHGTSKKEAFIDRDRKLKKDALAALNIALARFSQ